MIGLYIHIPFCKSKCNYCNFYSINYDKNLADKYTKAVIRNLEHYSNNGTMFDTVFFGGGTPSLLYNGIAEIMAFLKSRNAVTHDAEVTIEANPSDIAAEPQMCEKLLNCGVNRLSTGVQSLNDNMLKQLSRRHNAATAINAIKLAVKAGFTNISADIMLGMPNQTLTDLINTTNTLAAQPLTHISAYIYEPKVKQGRKSEGIHSPHFSPDACDNPTETAALPNEDAIAEMYLQTFEILEKHGFNQYEISNAARKGKECKHNLKYWTCRDYIGIGAASHSCHNGKRFAVKEDVNAFINATLQKTYITEETPYTPEEKIMLKLRLSSGITKSDYNNADWERLSAKSRQLPNEYVTVTSETISLTKRGFLLANSIIAELTDFM